MIDPCGAPGTLSTPLLETSGTPYRHDVQGVPNRPNGELSPRVGNGVSILARMLAMPAPRACVPIAPRAPAQALQPGPRFWAAGFVIGLRSSANPLKVNLAFVCFCVIAVPSCGLIMPTTGSCGYASAGTTCRLTPTGRRYEPWPGVRMYTLSTRPPAG